MRNVIVEGKGKERTIRPAGEGEQSTQEKTILDDITKLDELYGASISAGVTKIGEAQVVMLSMTYIDDRFALTDESIAEQCAQLLASMIFSPN